MGSFRRKRFFIRRYNRGYSCQCIEILFNYNFPGNLDYFFGISIYFSDYLFAKWVNGFKKNY